MQLDPEVETRLWQRLVNTETAIVQLNKAISENQQEPAGIKRLIERAENLEKSHIDLLKRITILEDARQRQVKLNQQILDQKMNKPEIKSVKSLWDLFKK
mgnify:CR=1 FL=1